MIRELLPFSVLSPIRFLKPWLLLPFSHYHQSNYSLQLSQIIPVQNVDVEEFKDAPVHKLPDAGHNPGWPPIGRQVYGLRPPHESRPRRLLGVLQASSCQRKENKQQRGVREPSHTRLSSSVAKKSFP